MILYSTWLLLANSGILMTTGQHIMQKFKGNSGHQYSVSNTTADLYTAREHCRDHKAVLANIYDLFISRQLSNLITSLGLHTNTSYWISGKPYSYSNGGCTSLTVQSTKNNWMILKSNCYDNYRFICQLDKKIPEPIVLQMSETQFPVIESTRVLSVYYNKHSEKTLQSDKTTQLSTKAGILTTESYFIDDKNHNNSATYLRSFQLLLTETALDNSMSKYTNISSKNTLSKLQIYTLSQISDLTSQTLDEPSNLFELCRTYCKFNLHYTGAQHRVKQTLSRGANDSLSLNVKTTSKFRRKNTSAADHRTSSQTMGCVAIIVLATVMLTITAMDIPRLFNGIRAINTMFT